MGKLPVLIATGLVLLLVFAAGCTGTSGTGPAANQATVPVAVPSQNVALSAIPVKYAEVNGVTLGYREFGSGEPLLMLNGFGATMDSFWNETFLAILASKYHVYIYDHRGMGYSTTNNTTPSIRQYADDAAGLMTALGYSSMNTYGASMGSTVSQQLAIDHPEKIRKMTLESVTYSIRIPQTKLLFALIDESAHNATAIPGVRDEALANLAWNGSWDQLPGINKNVLIVVGTADILTPDPVAVQIAGQINGSWLVRFKDMPHVGSRFAPVEYGKTELLFLATNESPPYSSG